MSETANGFLKAISNLTGPKSAVKYLVVVGVLIGTVNYQLTEHLEIPTDYEVFVTLLFAFGVGTLLGEGISSIFDLLWSKIKEWNAKNKLLNIEKKQKEEQAESIKAAVEKLKADFFVRVRALSIKEKQILKDVYLDSQGLNSEQVYLSPNNIAHLNTSLDGPLFTLGFLQIIEKFHSASALVKITPEINKMVGVWLKDGIEEEVDEFINRLKATDISLIRLLSSELSKEEKSKIAVKVRPYILNFFQEYSTPCITASAKGSRGVELRVSPLYKAHLEERLNIKLRDHTFEKTSYN